LFGVAVVDENSVATSAMAGFDISPTIAHDVAGLQIDVPDTSRFEQQPRLWLSAVATRGVIMRADSDAVQAEKALQSAVHFRYLIGGNQAPGDIGLIGDQDQGKVGLSQFVTGFANAGQQAKVGNRGGWVRLSVTHERSVHHSIAIQEHGTPHI
jgi:hypothetical protein